MTGTVPFRGTSVAVVLNQVINAAPKPPSSLAPPIDAAMDAICLKAMAKKPKDRFVSAKEFANALAEYLRKENVEAKGKVSQGDSDVTEAWQDWLIAHSSGEIPAARDSADVRPPSASLSATANQALPTIGEVPAAGELFSLEAGSERPASLAPRSWKLPILGAIAALLGFAIIAVLGASLLRNRSAKNRESADEPQPVVAVPPGKKSADPPVESIKAGATRQVEIAPGVFMIFCWIPPGECQLGSPEEERDAALLNINLHNKGKVPLFTADESESDRGHFRTTGFWMGKYEVTQGEWGAVMRGTDLAKPSAFRSGGKKATHVKPFFDTSRFPVESVSWDDCQTFLKSANAHNGIAKTSDRLASFALPSEEQWEYACRGGRGNKQPYYWGQELNGSQANIAGAFPFGTDRKGQFLDRPCPVIYDHGGLYPAHPWGLCHMIGNVSEWCGGRGEFQFHIVRGGSWFNFAVLSRSASRIRHSHDVHRDFSGLRLVLISE
jgi:formylglycine-generating enzyme required for sulfatase activity